MQRKLSQRGIAPAFAVRYDPRLDNISTLRYVNALTGFIKHVKFRITRKKVKMADRFPSLEEFDSGGMPPFYKAQDTFNETHIIQPKPNLKASRASRPQAQTIFSLVRRRCWEMMRINSELATIMLLSWMTTMISWEVEATRRSPSSRVLSLLLIRGTKFVQPTLQYTYTCLELHTNIRTREGRSTRRLHHRPLRLPTLLPSLRWRRRRARSN